MRFSAGVEVSKGVGFGCGAVFIMLIDYSLMLLVMTFNIGIIFSVVGGLSLGTLLFAHLAEPPVEDSSPLVGGEKAENKGEGVAPNALVMDNGLMSNKMIMKQSCCS